MYGSDEVAFGTWLGQPDCVVEHTSSGGILARMPGIDDEWRARVAQAFGNRSCGAVSDLKIEYGQAGA